MPESTAGKPIACRAAVCAAVGEPLTVTDVVVDPPKAGEVRLQVIGSSVCHSDLIGMRGLLGMPFPLVPGHEASGVVESVGPGVEGFAPGDHVLTCFLGQCLKPTCDMCMSGKTNHCSQATGAPGFLMDGTSRFRTPAGEVVHMFTMTATFSEYTVVMATHLAKVSKAADLNKICVLSCGVATGLGSVWNTAKVTPGSSVAVWGLGAVGLSVVQAAQQAGATRIYAVDVNKEKFEAARTLGATHCVLSEEGKSSGEEVVALTGCGGVDFAFDCTGHEACVKEALTAARRGWGKVLCIGLGNARAPLPVTQGHLLYGKQVLGSMFGDWKVRDLPALVQRTVDGTLPIDHYVTHNFSGIEKLPEAVELLKAGKCLRSVITFADAPASHQDPAAPSS
eukprot:Rhum_TRINITY_DN2943_c0_g4::Rhum_TRINITY_DN2943_c0_g4_i1::g.8888::m.8888/K00121/frmA, ADH5, adhC; S-(hydroxymethyl)glutathione dehydrogenase / alcohol dehydrogenase